MQEKDPKLNIKLERHLWPDELVQKKKKQRQTILIVVGLVLSFMVGILFNSAYLSKRSPLLNPSTNDNPDQAVETGVELEKFQTIYEILSNRWYFGKDYPNVSKQLLENAINGMIDLNDDKHTEYMSADELADFQSGLDAGFVGIGVQYYNIDGYNIVDRVLNNSPAQRAGVMAGDIFYAVNGQSVIGVDQDALQELVRGEANSTVEIDFKRGEAIVTLNITRGRVLSSAYGTTLENTIVGSPIGYLEINSFAQQTGDEVKGYLDMMKEQDIKKLIIDVRDNGGGYLTTLNQIASFFLDKDDIVIQEEFRSGEVTSTYASGNRYTNFETIVMLVNENSASASEVLTAALKENLNIEVIGVKTYGKGTVQVTYPFDDGSALKYTTAQWLSPNGNKINGLGIDPTIEVRLHEVFYLDFPTFEKEGESYKLDSVSTAAAYVQSALDFLGYDIARFDGYYDQTTYNSLLSYQESLNMRTDGIINKGLISSLSSSIIREWNLNKDIHDVQFNMALEVLARP